MRAALFLSLLLFSLPALSAPLSLKDAVRMALERNFVLRASRWDVAAKGERVKEAEAGFFPRLDLEAGYTRYSDPVAVVPIKGFGRRPPFFSKNIYHWQMGGVWYLYRGGRISGNYGAAKMERDASDFRWRLLRERVALDVVNTFNRVLQLEMLLDAQEGMLRALEKVYRDARLLAKVGRVASLDLFRMETELSRQREDVASTKRRLISTKRKLACLLGMDPAVPLEVKGRLSLLDAPLSFREELIEKRPDVEAARREVKRAERLLSSRKGEHLPEVFAAASYGRKAGAGFGGNEEVWKAGLYVRLNVFSGGAVSAGVREAEAELQRARLELCDVKLRAKSEVLDSIEAMKEARARVDAARSAVKSAGEAFRVERLRYLSGAGSVTDLLIAQARYLEAKARLAAALYDYNAAWAGYAYSTFTLLERIGGVK